MACSEERKGIRKVINGMAAYHKVVSCLFFFCEKYSNASVYYDKSWWRQAIVEEETIACRSGATASAIIASLLTLLNCQFM